ncbi:hypothetical protein SteCoe_31056 [Stentor coeruleus]|uniref:HMG box domain-containing protein n=1 Tax=Stentor coeruleus TaxID=5963 RepID=A0A1R2B2M0_9CILI|nr:hypothetical protein SteCoe_31056 [Stentor coeruleus]
MAKKNAVKNKDKGKKRKRQTKKDGPKKPLSGFMYFSQERRKSLKEEKPSLKITEASVLIGAEWKKLSETDKEPYQKLAKDDRDRYEKEKEKAETAQVSKAKEEKQDNDDEEESKDQDDDDDEDDE